MVKYVRHVLKLLKSIGLHPKNFAFTAVLWYVFYFPGPGMDVNRNIIPKASITVITKIIMFVFLPLFVLFLKAGIKPNGIEIIIKTNPNKKVLAPIGPDCL